jgi:predicted Zn-dependent protease
VIQELAETLIDGQAAYQAALEVLAQRAATDQHLPRLAALRAECLWGLGRATEAARVLDDAMQREAVPLRALVVRAQMFLADDQPQSALPWLEKAIQRDPHDVKSRQQLMQVYRQLGDQPRAEQHQHLLDESRGYKTQLTKLHEAAARRPWDDGIRYEIAELCLKINRPVEAKMWLQAALACNRDNTQARQLLEQLDGRTGAPTGSATPPRN